eukprot:GHVS01033198.1.p1 GENE.GHVS01033198.1~~GHVS01033198.1.p1  ORF type:complete len:151 (+),score=14.34 GHVS01033198.1:142-594(+)
MIRRVSQFVFSSVLLPALILQPNNKYSVDVMDDQVQKVFIHDGSNSVFKSVVWDADATTLEISVQQAAGTGYSWAVVEPVMSCVSAIREGPKPVGVGPIMGGPQVSIFRFTKKVDSRCPSNLKILLEFRRTYEGQSKPAQQTITITQNIY